MADFAQIIKERVSLDNILSKYGFETSRGKMCCPFHNEKTASFTVFKNNTYYCFGCGASGDVIKFVQDYLKCDFKTATRQIDNDFGLLLFDKPTLTQKRKMDNHIAELKKAEEERIKSKQSKSTNYWNAFDNVLLLEDMLKHSKPSSPDEEPNKAFIYALQKIGYARHCLECAETERRLTSD